MIRLLRLLSSRQPPLTLLLALLATPSTALAQATELGRQTLGRGYWHLFVGYAVAWLLVFGWVVSIARRLSRVEERVGPRE